MDYTICYLEIFDEETNQWEYVTKTNDPETINIWHNNLESFFDEFNLNYLCIAIENRGSQTLFPKYKGLPLDCSETIRNSYYFHFEEVTICHSASYFNLVDILNFDYNKVIDLTKIAPNDLKIFYPEIYKGKQKEISFKEWFGANYFDELEFIRNRFYKYSKCRIVYFLFKIVID